MYGIIDAAGIAHFRIGPRRPTPKLKPYPIQLIVQTDGMRQWTVSLESYCHFIHLLSQGDWMKTTLPAPQVEPWLRATRTETPAVVRAVLHAIDLALENIQEATEGLTVTQIDARPFGVASIGFHLRHLTGALDRSLTYASGSGLSEEQFGSLVQEKTSQGESRDLLLNRLRASATLAEKRLLKLVGADFEAPRAIGRKELPTTLGGIIVHIADHTQRHVGQVVTTARILREMNA